jgi:hypothetical protein
MGDDTAVLMAMSRAPGSEVQKPPRRAFRRGGYPNFRPLRALLLAWSYKPLRGLEPHENP